MTMVRPPDGYRRRWAAGMVGMWADGNAPGRLAPSRFERIAAENENLPAQLGDLVGLLLQAVYGADANGRAVLQPLWAEEGMQRAHAMLRLLERRTAAEPTHAPSRWAAQGERALACSLAGAYRSLGVGAEDEIVPCSAILRDLVRNLAALFGGRHGVIVRTEIERISLPAYKRRALVLCASELLLNALTHAFDGSSSHARLEISLRRLDSGRACLRVTDNGIGFRNGAPKPWVSIAGGLAELLEATLRYRRTGEGETVAEVAFPAAPGVGISLCVVHPPDAAR